MKKNIARLLLFIVSAGPSIARCQTLASSPPQTLDNEVIKAIFIADQRDRGNDPYAKGGDPQPTALPNPEIRKNDDAREVKLKAFLANGTVKTGTDFYRAALIFQHSGKPEGTLLAHVLSMIAVSKGNSSALWMSAATLDRYLSQVGQKQIFGTQFHSVANLIKADSFRFVQDELEHDLISDAVRAQFCVLPLAEQSKGLPGPPQGTGLEPCPAKPELRQRLAPSSR